MKKKTRTWIYSVILLGLSILLINACEKEDINPTNGKTTAVFNDSKTYGTMTDQDGNVYKTITIRNQTWMAENLRTTKYRDGSPIPEITDIETWKGLTVGAYCNYSTVNSFEDIATYGRLYNGHVISDLRNLAPKGWHVASNDEWSQLITHLGGENEAAGKLIETGETHWRNTNIGITNETGFTALPGGSFTTLSSFTGKGYYGRWWSSTASTAQGLVWMIELSSFSNEVKRGNDYKNVGYSVRCVKD